MPSTLLRSEALSAPCAEFAGIRRQDRCLTSLDTKASVLPTEFLQRCRDAIAQTISTLFLTPSQRYVVVDPGAHEQHVTEATGGVCADASAFFRLGHLPLYDFPAFRQRHLDE